MSDYPFNHRGDATPCIWHAARSISRILIEGLFSWTMDRTASIDHPLHDLHCRPTLQVPFGHGVYSYAVSEACIKAMSHGSAVS
jgi:hypothetical protein